MTDQVGGSDDQLDLELRSAAVELDHRLHDLAPGPFRPTPRRGPVVVGAVVALLAVGGALFVADRLVEQPTEGVEAATSAQPPPTEGPVNQPSDTERGQGAVSVDPLEEIGVGFAGAEPRLRAPLDVIPMDRWTNDPAFGAPMRRLTNMSPGDSAVPIAATVSAWNADETRLLLYRSGETPSTHQFLDLAADGSVAGVTDLDIDPADIEQVSWSRTNPEVLYYPTDNTLVSHNVVTGVETIVYRFEGCDRVDTGSGPVPSSADGLVWGLLCHSGDGVQAVAFDLATGTDRRVDVDDETTLAPIANRSGSRFVLETRNGTALLDADLRRIDDMPGLEDGNLVIVDGPSGVEWAVGVAFSTDWPGTAVAVDLSDPSARPAVIIGEESGYPYPPAGTYVVGSGLARPGLVLISVVGDAADGDATVVDGEILLIDTTEDEPVVRRIAHHRSSGESYLSEPHISLSPSGRYAVFASDWASGGSTGMATNTFLVDLTGAAGG